MEQFQYYIKSTIFPLPEINSVQE